MGQVFRTFRALCFMDETIYLRAGSLNTFSGMVRLSFTCDGSHYMPWGQFLEKSLGFWLETGEPAMDGEHQENGQQLGGRGEDATPTLLRVATDQVYL